MNELIALPVDGGVPMEDVVDMTELNKRRKQFEELPEWAKKEILSLRKELGDLRYDSEYRYKQLLADYRNNVPYTPGFVDK